MQLNPNGHFLLLMSRCDRASGWEAHLMAPSREGTPTTLKRWSWGQKGIPGPMLRDLTAAVSDEIVLHFVTACGIQEELDSATVDEVFVEEWDRADQAP